MAADGAQHADSNAADFQTHKRDYGAFLTALKISIVVVAIITALVIFLISN